MVSPSVMEMPVKIMEMPEDGVLGFMRMGLPLAWLTVLLLTTGHARGAERYFYRMQMRLSQTVPLVTTMAPRGRSQIAMDMQGLLI